MSRFVEFRSIYGLPVWINADCVFAVVDCIPRDGQPVSAIIGANDGSQFPVPGAVPEVLAKLQGEPQPTKTAEDIAGNA